MTNRYVLDIESDGLLDTIKNIWCIVLRDIDTDEVFSFIDNDLSWQEKIVDGVTIVGHNIAITAIAHNMLVLSYSNHPFIQTVTQSGVHLSVVQNFWVGGCFTHKARQFIIGTNRIKTTLLVDVHKT